MTFNSCSPLSISLINKNFVVFHKILWKKLNSIHVFGFTLLSINQLKDNTVGNNMQLFFFRVLFLLMPISGTTSVPHTYNTTDRVKQRTGEVEKYEFG